ncbi:hypothetical protein [Stenotrophomonas maltophilia]|uniref:hypothetical protein n=1 Tax=Stenotrophomonas maltophilia TaxID=40324 RepID=UPI000A2FADAD|nr:hypothetical protein [Stenotrophomonas maltophilia]ARQ89187.1 hypothetical protein A7326_06100 [Stenotrophomonas maltophilia]
MTKPKVALFAFERDGHLLDAFAVSSTNQLTIIPTKLDIATAASKLESDGFEIAEEGDYAVAEALDHAEVVTLGPLSVYFDGVTGEGVWPVLKYVKGKAVPVSDGFVAYSHGTCMGFALLENDAIAKLSGPSATPEKMPSLGGLTSEGPAPPALAEGPGSQSQQGVKRRGVK